MQIEHVLLCGCGCGTQIPLRDSRGRPRRFVHGHSGGPSFGHEVTAETREKIRQTKIGERNGLWKGEEASYNAIHRWLFRHYEKSGVCDECWSERKTEWANISGEYRRDRDDFLELCVPCHRRFDIANPKRPTRLAPSQSHLRIGEKDG